jgi:environmental stress-induced protein Ves
MDVQGAAPRRYKAVVQLLTVRTADVAPQPWKNGGGVTRELLALPPGSDWRVRISVADVASDGDFSSFAGVGRWFAVVEGAGVVLTVDGREHRCTRDDDEALAFAGAARTSCRLIDGATRDLNLMLRGVRGALARVVAGRAWQPRQRACGLYATAPGNVRGGGEAQAPMAADTLRWWPAAPAAIAFDGAGWWLDADAEPPR